MVYKRDVVLIIFVIGIFSACIYAILTNPIRSAVAPQEEAKRARLILEHEEQIARNLGAQWQQFHERQRRGELEKVQAGRQVEVPGSVKSGEQPEAAR